MGHRYCDSPWQELWESTVNTPGGSEVRWRTVTHCCQMSRDYPAAHLQRERWEGEEGGGGVRRSGRGGRGKGERRGKGGEEAKIGRMRVMKFSLYASNSLRPVHTKDYIRRPLTWFVSNVDERSGFMSSHHYIKLWMWRVQVCVCV